MMGGIEGNASVVAPANMTVNNLAHFASETGQYLKGLWNSSDIVGDFTGDGASLATEADYRRALSSGSDTQREAVVRQLIADVLQQRCVHRLLPDVMRVMLTPSLSLKRLCFVFMALSCQYVDRNAREGLFLLPVNAIQKDASHRNHIVRAWSLRALASLKIPEVIPVLAEALQRGVADGSPFVRLTAALTIPTAFRNDPGSLNNIITVLLPRLLNDIEVSVVGAAMQALYEIVTMKPNLLTVDNAEFKLISEKYEIPEKSLPLLSSLHAPFIKIVEEHLLRMPPQAQSPTIYLLTCYCRTFVLEPCISGRTTDAIWDNKDVRADISGGGSSEHLHQFKMRLHELMCYTSSVSVAITASAALIYLSPGVLAVYEQVVYVIIHWLTLYRHQQNTRSAPACFLLLHNLLALIAERYPDIALSALPTLSLVSREQPPVREAKLRTLKLLASCPGFPFDDVLDGIVTAVHWEELSTATLRGSEKVEGFDSQRVAKLLDALTSMSLQQGNQVAGPNKDTLALMTGGKNPAPLDNCIKVLIGLVTESHSPVLVDEAIRCLYRASIPQARSTERVSSITLHIARHLVTLISAAANTTGKTLRPQGCAAMIAVIAFHHAKSVAVALEVFRVLTRALAENNPIMLSTDVALEFLELGASLWSHFHPSSHRDEGGDKAAKFQRLDSMWRFALDVLSAQKDAQGHESIVSQQAKLFKACSSEDNSGDFINKFIAIERELPNESATEVSKPTPPSPYSGCLDLWGSISFMIGRSLGSSRSLADWIPDFASPESLQDGSRCVVTDSERLQLLAPVSRPISPRGRRGEPEEDDLNTFYEITEDEVRLALSGGRSSNEPDAITSLFGIPSSATPSCHSQEGPRGHIVFGEAAETDDEEVEGPVHQGARENTEINKISQEGDSDDDDDWDQIMKEAARPVEGHKGAQTV